MFEGSHAKTRLLVPAHIAEYDRRRLHSHVRDTSSHGSHISRPPMSRTSRAPFLSRLSPPADRQRPLPKKAGAAVAARSPGRAASGAASLATAAGTPPGAPCAGARPARTPSTPRAGAAGAGAAAAGFQRDRRGDGVQRDLVRAGAPRPHHHDRITTTASPPIASPRQRHQRSRWH